MPGSWIIVGLVTAALGQPMVETTASVDTCTVVESRVSDVLKNITEGKLNKSCTMQVRC